MQLNEYVIQFGVLSSYPKQQHLIRQGQADGCLYFIKSGLVKAYYLTEDGKEFIKSFITAGNTIGSLSTLHGHQPSTFSLICLEDTEAFKIDFDHLYRTALQDKELNQVMMETLIKLAQKRKRGSMNFFVYQLKPGIN